MRLTVLGCAGSFPGPEAACSAYLIEVDDFRLSGDQIDTALALVPVCDLRDA